MRAPGIVRVLRDVSDFLGSSVHARDGPVAVTPEDYLAASGEALALNVIMSWIIAAIWNRDVIKDNPLLDRFGYNNVCVAWDEPPALYPAAFVMQFAVYCAVRYCVLDYVRGAVTPDLSRRKVQIIKFCNTLYAVSIMAVPLIFVVTPKVSPSVHTTFFVQLIVCRFVVVAGNFVEVEGIPREKWAFLAVYGLVSVLLTASAFINFVTYDSKNKKKPTVPMALGMIFDYSWFACLAVTGRFLPEQTPLQITYQLQPGTAGGVAENLKPSERVAPAP